MVEIGDIVRIGTQPERWAVMGFTPSPRGLPPAVRLSRPGDPDGPYPIGLTVAGPEGLQLVDRPEFSPGQRVTAGGYEGTVIEDRGLVVRVALDPRRRQLEGEGSISFTGETDAARGPLVRDNLL